MIETLEPRRVMSAVSAIDDVMIVQSQTDTPTPVQLDVLANDDTSQGTAQIVSVGTVAYGSVTIQNVGASGPVLLFTPEVGFVGIESFTYTIADAMGDESSATVLLEVTGSSSSAGSSAQSAASGAASGTESAMSSAGSSASGAVDAVNNAASGIASYSYGSSGFDSSSGFGSASGQASTSSFGDPTSWINSAFGSGSSSGDPMGMSGSGTDTSGSSSGGELPSTYDSSGSGSASGTGESGSGSASGSESGSATGSGSGTYSGSSAVSGYQLQSGYLIDSHTLFVLANLGNYSTTTTSTDPVNSTIIGTNNVSYVTSGTSTSTLTITATDNGAGIWTYSESYLVDETVSIVGVDGSITSEHDWVQYLFVASGDGTTTTFNFNIDDDDLLTGTVTDGWQTTATDGSVSAGAIDWNWTSHSHDHIALNSGWNLMDNTAVVTSEWESSITDSYIGSGSYSYEIAGGTVSGGISSTDGSFDNFSASGSEVRAADGTWTWSNGTSQHSAGTSSDYQYSGAGSYSTSENGVSLSGGVQEYGETFDESADSESGQVGTDGAWTWYAGSSTFNGFEAANSTSSGTGTYTDSTENSTVSGTIVTQSGYTSNSAYSGAGTLGANETWNWTQGGSTFTSAANSDFASSGAGTYSYSTTTGTVSGTTHEVSNDQQSEDVSISSTLLSDGTWSAATGVSKSTGTSLTVSSYEGAGTYSYDLANPPNASGSGEASGSGTSGVTDPDAMDGTVNGTIIESGLASDSISYSAEQSLQADGTWAWNSSQASDTSSLDAHYASSGTGSYSYAMPDDSGTISGEVHESSHNDSHIGITQQAALNASGDWTITSGLMDANGSIGNSSLYSGGGDYSRPYGDGDVKGQRVESGGASSEFSYDTHAALDSNGDWQWTSGTSHVSNDINSYESYSGSGSLTSSDFGNFSGKAKEQGYQQFDDLAEFDQTLSPDGKWTATSGTSTATSEDYSWSWFSGTGSITTLSGDMPFTIDFAADNDQFAKTSSVVVQTVQADGTWATESGDKKVSTYNASNTAYSGTGAFSVNDTAVSMQIGIHVEGATSSTNADNENQQLDATGQWQLISGDKSAIDYSTQQLAYSGSGTLALSSFGDTSSLLITGGDEQTSNFADTQQVGTTGDWWLTSGTQSTFSSSGYSMSMSGTMTFPITQSNASLNMTAGIASYDYQSETASTSSEVTGIGAADQHWGETVGAKTSTNGTGFSMSGSGTGTMALDFMDGELNATLQVSNSDSTDHNQSLHYNLGSSGTWNLDGGTIVDSSTNSSKVTLAGIGTYTRAVDGGSVTGTTHLLDMTSAESHLATTTQTFAPAGGWAYTDGSKSDHTESRFDFAYAGLGAYTHPATGGAVVGTISEGGSTVLDDTEDQSYGVDAYGIWVFSQGNKVEMSSQISNYSASGKGGYSYDVVGGGVVGLINENSWANTSDVEMVTTTAAAIGPVMTIGTKTINNDAGSQTNYQGTGRYNRSLPNPSSPQSSMGNITGDIQEDGGSNSDSFDNESWSTTSSGQWYANSGARGQSFDDRYNYASSGSGSYTFTETSNNYGSTLSQTHVMTQDEEAEYHRSSSDSSANVLNSDGTWSQTSGQTSTATTSHTSASASGESGKGKYDYSEGGGTSTSGSGGGTADFKSTSGGIVEMYYSLNDSSETESTTFASGGWTTAGGKSSKVVSNAEIVLSGSGSYGRNIPDGFVNGTITEHEISNEDDSDYSDGWIKDDFGWHLLSGTKGSNSSSGFGMTWNGAGMYSRSVTGTAGDTWTSVGTVTDNESTAEQSDSNGDSWTVANGQWVQFLGSKSHSDLSEESSTASTSGSGNYTRPLKDGYSGTISGTFVEGGSWYEKVRNSEEWSYNSSNGWKQQDGSKIAITKQSASDSYSGSGGYKHGMINGTYSSDTGSNSQSTSDSRVDTFDAITGTWTLDWSGGNISDVTTGYAYSGTGTTKSDPPITTQPFSTVETHRSDTATEDFTYNSHNKVTNSWTSDRNGNRVTTTDTETSLLDDQYTFASGQGSGVVTEWYNVMSSGDGAITQQTHTYTTESSSSFSLTSHLESSGSSHIVTDGSTASGSSTTHSTGYVDHTSFNGSVTNDIQSGPNTNSWTKTTSSSSIQTHDDFDSTATLAPGTSGSGGSGITNHVTGFQTPVSSYYTYTDANPGGSGSSYSSTTTYDTTVNYDRYYNSAYYATAVPQSLSNAGGTPPAPVSSKQSTSESPPPRTWNEFWWGLPGNVVDSIQEPVRDAATNVFNMANGNLWREMEIQGQIKERATTVQYADQYLGVAYDNYRNSLAEQAKRPVPESWNRLIQSAELAVAGMYGSRPGGLGARSITTATIRREAMESLNEALSRRCVKTFGGGACFVGDTQVNIAPEPPVMVAASADSEESAQLAWLLAGAGIAMIGRVAVRKSRDDDEEEASMSGAIIGKEDRSPQKRGVAMPPAEPVTMQSDVPSQLAARSEAGPEGMMRFAGERRPLRRRRSSIFISEAETAATNSPGSADAVVANLADGDSPRSSGSRHLRQRKQHSRWLTSLIGTLTLAVAALCLWQALPAARRAEAVSAVGQTPSAPTTRAISQIKPLDWVLAGNPEGNRDLQFGEVIEPAQWRLMTLVAPKKEGGTADVVMARPMSWLHSQWRSTLAGSDEEDDSDDGQAVTSAELAAFDPQQLVGRTVYVSVPECGIDGHAQVLAIHDCPNPQPRPGPEYQLVTATYRHHAVTVLDLTVEGANSPIGTTANHPFWSEDRRDFVRADSLQPGERLRGKNGTFPRVIAAAPRPGTHDVYNLEVHLDHVYHVANNGLLVHNGDVDPNCVTKFYHGTNIESALSFLNGARLNAAAAASRKIDGKAGFYLAEHLDDATVFAARRNGGVVGVDITQSAIHELKSAGATIGPIPPGRMAFFNANEFFIPTSAFDTFNRLLDAGQIRFGLQ